MRGRSFRNTFVGTILPPLVVFVAATVIWEGAMRLRDAAWDGQSYLMPLPRPSGLVRAMIAQPREMFSGFWTTAQGALIGFGAAGLLGVLTAIILGTSRWMRQAFYPYTILFQTVPVVAIAPMLVIWIGAGLASVAIVSFIVAVFPVIANTLSGLVSTDPALEDLFRLYGSGRIARLWKLRLPWALPNILTGLRVAAGLSVIGAVVAEFFVGNYGPDEGLGVRIASNAKWGNTDAIFADVVLASVLGLALFGCVSIAGKLLLRRWHPSEN